MKTKTDRHYKFSDYKKAMYAKDPTMEARVDKEYLKLVNAELKTALKEKAVLERALEMAIRWYETRYSGFICDDESFKCKAHKCCIKNCVGSISSHFKAKAEKGGY